MRSRKYRLFARLATRPLALALSLVVGAALSLASLAPAHAATAPGPPTGVTAVPGNAEATVSWTPPSSEGGSAVTGYTVSSIPAGETASATASATSAVVTGLTNGTSYRFTVTATNAVGTSVASASSAAVTPAAPVPPATPVITNVTARDSAVEITWSPPDTGTTGLTGYTIAGYSGGTEVATASEPASSTDATISGLANGTGYTFTITATNAAGTSPASPATAPVAPVPATAPLAPADVQAVPQNGQIQVAWAAPPDGGSPITGYTVSVSPATVSPVTTAAGTTVTTVSGLTNGTSYTISVTATNAAGTSPAASASAVTPAVSIVPGAPASLSAVTTAAGSVELEWAPPASAGTSAITSYTVTDTPGTTSATTSFPASDCSGTPALCEATKSGLTATSSYVFSVTATSAAGTGPASAPTSSVQPDLVVSQAPIVLSSASVATLQSVGTDGTLYFDQPPAQVTSLAAGDLVQVNPATAVPDGLLATVVQVTAQSGLVAVTTTPATLANEYSTLGASVTLPINSASMQTVYARPGVAIDRPSAGGRPLGGRPASANPQAEDGAGVTWTGTSLVLSVNTDLVDGNSPQGEDASVVSGPTAQLQGSVTLTPQLHATVVVPDVTFNMSTKVDADISGQFGTQLGTQQRILLAEIGDDALETPIGPQDVTFGIYATLYTNGSVGVSFEAGYHQTIGTNCTVNFTTPNAPEDTCSGSHQDNGSGLDVKSALYGSMDVQAGVQFAITWQMEDVAGPSLLVGPYVEADVDTTANPWEDVSIGADVGVAVVALNDCQLVLCLSGITLWSDPNLISGTLFDLWNSGGPFQGLVLSPNVTEIGPGETTTFTATTPAGQISSASVTWKVVSGPGTISSAGTYTAGSGDGTAVIEADYDGLTARAGVIVGSVLEGPDVDQPDSPHGSRGLVDAILASWEPPESGAVTPASYTVTAQATTPMPGTGSFSASASATVPYPETYAYLPNLAPGVVYNVTVSAIGSDGTAVAAPSVPLTPLDPLPGAMAGTGDLQDVSSLTYQFPDKTGVAGYMQAAISGNGQYAFYLVEGRSPLAPASVFDPTSTQWYLVRESLVGPATVQLASVGPDDTPVPVDAPGPGLTVTVNEDGSAVAFEPESEFQISGYSQVDSEVVYDFDTNTDWVIGPPSGYYFLTMGGLTSDGTAVFTAQQDTDTDAVAHVYVQPPNGAATQIDSCVADDTAAYCGQYASVSSGGLVVYNGAYASNADVTAIYLYNISSGSNTEMFTGNSSADNAVYDPAISPDGTHVALNYEPVPGFADDGSGVAIATVNGPTITGSDIVAPYDNVSTFSYPVSLGDNGTLAYAAVNLNNVQADGSYQTSYKVYAGGSTLAAPSLSYTNGECTDGSGSAQLDETGTALLYALCLPEDVSDGNYDNYPGVYEWQVP